MKIFQEMIEMNSYTDNAEGVNALGKFTEDLFAPFGFSAEYIPSENPSYGNHLVLSKKGNSSRTIACVSHLDTVFPPEEEIENNFSWRIEGDKVYGPGTNDIKGGTLIIYMMIDLLSNLFPDSFNRVSWSLLFDASEETLSEDFGALCVSRLKEHGAACLVFEAGHRNNNEFNLVTARKGRAVFKIETAGKGAHAGAGHHKGASAILQLADVLARAAEITDYERSLTVNAGSIRGGTGLNRVPHYAAADVEMRAFSPEAFDLGKKALMDLNGFSSRGNADGSFLCSTTVSLVRETPSWPVNEGTRELAACWERAANNAGLTIVHEHRAGLSDGNFTWDSIPTIDGLGPEGENAHCSESVPGEGKEQEYAVISSFVPKTVINVLAVLELVGE
ncbi:MAG: M20 family metallopeptidase [bacterium]|nr:M20 family metallopeptidase [bacterium]